MSNFIPSYGYVEVEPLESGGVLRSDEKKWVEKATVIKVGKGINEFYPSEIEIGDIIFFRPHGFFELAEHEGVIHYVVRVDREFILGIYKNESSVAEQ